MNKKLGVGVVIARHQTSDLTAGQLKTLYAADQHNTLVILLGCSEIPSRQNVLDFPTRKLMVQQAFPRAIILPIFDKYSNEVWTKQLDDLLESLFQFQEITLYGSRDSFIPKYSGKFKTELVEEVPNTSATEVRLQCASAPRASSDFRAGVIYGKYNEFARVNPTVDVCIHRKIEKRIFVLLGRKSFEPLTPWCFSGGFVDVTDSSLEEAATREVFEECQISCASNDLKFITSAKVQDWRSTEDNTVMTTFFGLSWPKGKKEPKAGDDLKEVKWFSLDAAELVIGQQHKYLLHKAKIFLGGR